MAVFPLTSKQRAFLRGEASALEPVLTVGKAGVTPATLAALNTALRGRELVKCAVLESCPLSPREAADILAERADCAPVTVIGRRFVLYRPNPDKTLPRYDLTRLRLVSPPKAAPAAPRAASAAKKRVKPGYKRERARQKEEAERRRVREEKAEYFRERARAERAAAARGEPPPPPPPPPKAAKPSSGKPGGSVGAKGARSAGKKTPPPASTSKGGSAPKRAGTSKSGSGAQRARGSARGTARRVSYTIVKKGEK